MLRDFNLLSTTSRGNEIEACSELRYLLGEIGDSDPAIDKTGISGLVAAKTVLSPLDVIEKFRKILQERPYEFRYLLRVIPIGRVVRTDLAEIREAAIELASGIAEDERFRVTVEKRFTQTPTRDIIEAAAASIQRKVDLAEPQKIVLVEVVGGLTGLSLIKPGEILSVLKEKLL